MGCLESKTDRDVFSVDVDGVDSADEVGDLTDRELAAICGEYTAYVRTEVSFDQLAYVGCLPAAIVLSQGDADRCLSLLDNCTSAFPDPIEVEVATSSTATCVDDLKRCDSQVIDLEGCVNLNLDLLFDILSNWTCGNNGEDRIAEAAKLMDSVSVCADSCDFGGLPQGPF